MNNGRWGGGGGRSDNSVWETITIIFAIPLAAVSDKETAHITFLCVFVCDVIRDIETLANAQTPAHTWTQVLRITTQMTSC